MLSQRASFVVNISSGNPSGIVDPSSALYAPVLSTITACVSCQSCLPPVSSESLANVTVSGDAGVPAGFDRVPEMRMTRGKLALVVGLVVCAAARVTEIRDSNPTREPTRNMDASWLNGVTVSGTPYHRNPLPALPTF